MIIVKRIVTLRNHQDHSTRRLSEN